MTFTSLPPPPRRAPSASSGLISRRPKVNPKASARDFSLENIDQMSDVLSQTHIQSPDLSQYYHLPQCKYYSRPRSIASISSLSSESVSQCGRRTNGQAPRSPPFSETSEPNTNIYSSSSRLCSSCHTSDCPSLAIDEDGEEQKEFCQRRALSISEDDNGSEHYMTEASGHRPSCSYCSSIRSNSVSSTFEQMFESRNDYLKSVVVPNQVRRRLSFHLDECWFVHFSPSSEYLASIGRDYSVVIWKDIVSPEPSVHLSFSLTKTVTTIEWSPDSKYILLNLGFLPQDPDNTPVLKIIDIQTGEIVFVTSYLRDGEPLPARSICWFPDSERFLAAFDGVNVIWNIKGEILHEFPVDKLSSAMHLKSIPGKDEFVVNTELTTEVISFNNGKMSSKFLDHALIMTFAMTVSSDGAYLAKTLKSDKSVERPAQIALYDLKNMTFLRFFEAETYINDMFVMIPSIVGPNMELLCAGSENGLIHYWDIESGELVHTIEEHSSHVGCISVNTCYPGMVASCSDDNSILIWTTDRLREELTKSDEKWMIDHPTETLPTVNIKKGW
ncbi:hypothetical protein BGZ76_010318 [Entomortierella beljakovae]|nr:hypothetical protein BGZ76_010318 [Entomortierella beljakovae]